MMNLGGLMILGIIKKCILVCLIIISWVSCFLLIFKFILNSISDNLKALISIQ